MTIEQRLEQLAKRNKRLTIALTMMAVTICAVVTMAATGEKRGDFDIVTARYINLKNETGDYLVRLRANPAATARSRRIQRRATTWWC